MPHWVLDCINCGRKFEFSETTKPALFSDIGDKPPFPNGGQSAKCPHCQETHTYQRYMLKLSSD